MTKSKKPNGFFDRLHRRIMWSAFTCPGYGQWNDGSRAIGAVLMAAFMGPVLFVCGTYFYWSIKIQTCPDGFGSLSEVLPCFSWVLEASWIATVPAARTWGLVAVVVYLVSLAEAMIRTRGAWISRGPESVS